MVTPREIFVPQAMQRHTGCAWVHPACAAEKIEKPKPEAAEHDPEKACPGLDPGWVPVFGKDHAQIITTESGGRSR